MSPQICANLQHRNFTAHVSVMNCVSQPTSRRPIRRQFPKAAFPAAERAGSGRFSRNSGMFGTICSTLGHIRHPDQGADQLGRYFVSGGLPPASPSTLKTANKVYRSFEGNVFLAIQLTAKESTLHRGTIVRVRQRRLPPAYGRTAPGTKNASVPKGAAYAFAQFGR
jgi:hypothetical protein